MLRLIEIELFSYCNRKCRWCSNCLIDRTFFSKLNEKTFISLLEDLKNYGYKGVFSFSRYNEPFANFELFNNRLKILKTYFPKNKLVCNSNGDYITKEIIKDMLIDELTIMDYDNKPKEILLEKLKNLGVINIKEIDNFLIGVYENKKIMYYSEWLNKGHITDRGGVLTNYSKCIRDYPCYEPQYFLGINYDGTVSPCCNIRNDIDKHKPYIFGNINEQKLSNILKSSKYIKFIEDCANARFYENSPCYTCMNKGGRYTRENGGIYYE